MSKCKPETSTSIIESPRLGVHEDVYKTESGEIRRLRVTHPGAVVILAMNAQQEIVLVEQYRHAIGTRILELPAGTRDRREDALSCAKRELIEETGCQATQWDFLGELCPAPGFCDERQQLFFARDLSWNSARPEELEDIIVRVMPLVEVRKAIKTLEIIDAKTIAAMYRAELLGLFAN